LRVQQAFQSFQQFAQPIAQIIQYSFFLFRHNRFLSGVALPSAGSPETKSPCRETSSGEGDNNQTYV
jgi:hypothetical protein